MSNLLFICSKNQWRSPTAELLFRNHPIHHARSAGTSEKARVKVNQTLIDWADFIFFMESRHRAIVKKQFHLGKQQILVLDIADEYQFGDEELIKIFQTTLFEFL